METKKRRHSNRRKRKDILSLFLVFLKIGAFTFGGGYAMIPLIQREITENRKWLSDDDILEIVAIAESTPGPIAINAATFVGYQVAGFFGAFFATLGVVLPSFLIISVLSVILNAFENVKVVRYAFFGIRAGVLALLVKSLYSMYKRSPKGVAAYIIMAIAFLLVAIFKVNVLFVIIGAAVFGLIMTWLARRTEQ